MGVYVEIQIQIQIQTQLHLSTNTATDTVTPMCVPSLYLYIHLFLLPFPSGHTCWPLPRYNPKRGGVSQNASCLLCPSGTYCNAGSRFPGTCRRGFYCPRGTRYERRETGGGEAGGEGGEKGEREVICVGVGWVGCSGGQR